MAEHYVQTPQRGQGLVDVVDRILDKGLVIAGDIRINLANVELLTIRIRLLLCSIDKAEQIGIDWWRRDPGLVGPGYDGHDVTGLNARLDSLVGRLEQLEQSSGGSTTEEGSSSEE